MQLMAILLPADTPVTSGSALPLNVHWGPVLAAWGAIAAPAVAPGLTKAMAAQQQDRHGHENLAETDRQHGSPLIHLRQLPLVKVPRSVRGRSQRQALLLPRRSLRSEFYLGERGNVETGASELAYELRDKGMVRRNSAPQDERAHPRVPHVVRA